MDYNRIYDSFIADRRSKGKPSGYTEKHHILPRSLGGNNDPENLVYLTASDHLFAHLLLAKIYGGGMWSAYYRMQKDPRKKGRVSRILINTAKENFSLYVSSINKNRIKSEQECRNISAGLKGKPKSKTHVNALIISRSSELYKTKMSESVKRSHLCEDTKKKRSAAIKASHAREDVKSKRSISLSKAWEKRRLEGKTQNKKVIIIETEQCFDSIINASKFLNIKYYNISHAISGRQKTAGGYRWMYYDDWVKTQKQAA